MAEKLLQQGKDVQWLADDANGAALVKIKASEVSLGAPVSYDLQSNEVSSTVSYYGEALPGTATSAASWRVKKVTLDAAGQPTVEWEGGTAAFDKVWDTYEAL